MLQCIHALGVVLGLVCAALVAGCAGDRMSRSTAEAVDDHLLANKVKVALYAAIPAYAPKLLRDYESEQLSERFDHRVVSFDVHFVIGHDRSRVARRSLVSLKRSLPTTMG